MYIKYSVYLNRIDELDPEEYKHKTKSKNYATLDIAKIGGN